MSLASTATATASCSCSRTGRTEARRGNPDHARTVAEAFPPSTSAALPLLAERRRESCSSTSPSSSMRDWNDVAGTLARSQQGTYSVARDRSSIYRPYTQGLSRQQRDRRRADVRHDRPARRDRRVDRARRPRVHAAAASEFSQASRRRDSARACSIRASASSESRFKDYAQPIQEPLTMRWTSRHRLERVNPNDPNSPIKEPIRYYVDRGIPEPIRTATLEGVNWWEQAFDRAGLEGRIQGRAAARRRGSDGRAVQRGAVGEPQRARMVGRRGAHRSADRRDHQRHGAPRFTSRAHRLQPVRRADGRGRVGGRHGVRAGARAPGERARSRAHTRPLAQLHRLDVRARLGDGLSAAARAAGRERSTSTSRRRMALGRALRRVGDSLGLRDLPDGERARFAARDRRRRACRKAICIFRTPTRVRSTARIRA